METNALPKYDMSDNPTGCCPRFKSEGWDGAELHFKDKKFAKAVTHSLMHLPIDMGKVFTKMQKHIEDVDAFDPNDYIVMSKDISSWKAEHYFAVPKEIPSEEMTTLSGDFVTKVFEGPFRDAKGWHDKMQKIQRENGADPGEIYFFYTTCPKCANTYGENYVVGVAAI